MTQNVSNICYRHFDDRYIKQHIIDNFDWEKCKYCEKPRPTLEADTLADYIEECLRYEYDDPYAQGAPYDKEGTYYEDRFFGVDVSTAEEVLMELSGLDDYDIAVDITSHFENQYLTEVDAIYGTTQNQYMRNGWDSFQKIIKHKIRFVFFNPYFSKQFIDEDGEILNPHQILEEVANSIVELGLFSEYKTEELEVFRGIQHNNKDTHNTARRLGSPPYPYAKANRMSPAGISMFYGAFERETCLMEIKDINPLKDKITLGQFKNLVNFNLIDFTKLKEIPSLFDLKNRDKRYAAKFIQSFIKDLSIPVKPDDSVHIDYVPTQVVTEYLKYMMPDNIKVNGIIYNSVKNVGNKCVVLFVENQELCDEPSSGSSEELLMLIKRSLKIIDA